RPKLSAPRKLSLVVRAMALRRWPALAATVPSAFEVGPSLWSIDPEPDPDASRFPRALAGGGEA
ncbi:MAG: hypothetical protein ACO3QC_15230, partial [Phycisphaerales bacterium]